MSDRIGHPSSGKPYKHEHDEGYELDIDLPGFKKDEIKLSLDNGYLSVSAAKSLDKDKKNINKCEMHAAVYNKYTNKCVEVFGAVEDVRQLYYALKQYFEKEY